MKKIFTSLILVMLSVQTCFAGDLICKLIGYGLVSFGIFNVVDGSQIVHIRTYRHQTYYWGVSEFYPIYGPKREEWRIKEDVWYDDGPKNPTQISVGYGAIVMGGIILIDQYVYKKDKHTVNITSDGRKVKATYAYKF